MGQGARRRRLLAALVVALTLAFAVTATSQTAAPVAVVNTDATNFTVLAGQSGKNLRVLRLDAQNVGAAKVTLKLCDGTCATAANVKYELDLSAGGGWTFSAAQWGLVEGAWGLAEGAALIARVDTGATNNVKISVIYRVYPF